MSSKCESNNMESEPFLYVTGKRSTSQLIYLINQKQLYKKRSYYKGKTYYTCYTYGCKARIEISQNQSCVKCKNSEHVNHPDQEELYNELISIQSIKEQCISHAKYSNDYNASSVARKVFENVCNSNQESTKRLVFSSMQRTLERLSSKRKEKSIMLQTKIPTKWHLYSKVGKILGKLPNNVADLQTGSSSRVSVSDYDNDISKSSSIGSESNSEDFVICRTCLIECKHYKSLYNYGIIEGEKTTLATLLTFCTNLQLSEQDSPILPSYICKKCIGELTRSYFFKKKVLDADNLLKSEFNDNYIINDQIQDQSNIKIEKLTDLNDTIDTNDIKSEFSYDEQCENDHQKADDLIEYILQDDLDKDDDDIIIDETDNITVKTEEQDDNNVSQLHFEKNQKVNSNTESKNGVEDILIQKHSTAIHVIICKVCGKQFKDRNFFAHHMQLHAHNTLYKCKVCDKTFKTSNGYAEHKSMHEPNICDVCGKSYRLLFSLKAHMKMHTGETVAFTCEICDKKFMRKWGYEMHMLIHTGENRTRAKPYACDICGKSFYNYKKMFSHRENHGGLRKFKCTKCYQRFSNVEKLKRHMRMHKESLLCHICSQTFTRETSLQIHLRCHGEHTKSEPSLS